MAGYCLRESLPESFTDELPRLPVPATVPSLDGVAKRLAATKSVMRELGT
jgi:hypothetical protein